MLMIFSKLQFKIFLAFCKKVWERKNDSKYNIMKRQVFYCLWNFIFIAVSQTVITNPLPPGCYQSNYTTNFTRCDLTFLFCYSRQILQQCVMRKCDRYIRGAECYLQTGFILEEPNCYQSCCGLSQFNEKACNNYNNDAAARQSKAITGLVIVMVIIAAGLLAIVAWFSVKHLRCCDKSSPFLILKYNIKWRTDKYEQKKCEICRTYGPLMVTPCGHHFHISCFQQASKEMVCPKCQQIIADRIKIFCFHCREKSFKVRLYRVIDIAQAIAQGKALHYDLCPKQIKTYRQGVQSAEKL